MDTPTEFYYIDAAGETQGPATRENLQQLLEAGKLTPSTLISHENAAQWVRLDLLLGSEDNAHAMDQLFSLPTAPAAAVFNAVSAPPCPQAAPAKSVWEYIRYCLTSGYSQFSGRATRKEYFSFFFAFYALLTILTSLIVTMMFLASNPGGSDYPSQTAFVIALGSVGTAWIAIMIPSYAVLSRRLNDIGWSGVKWAGFLAAANLIGLGSLATESLSVTATMCSIISSIGSIFGFVSFIGCCIDSEKKSNQHGPSPKYPDAC